MSEIEKEHTKEIILFVLEKNKRWRNKMLKQWVHDEPNEFYERFKKASEEEQKAFLEDVVIFDSQNNNMKDFLYIYQTYKNTGSTKDTLKLYEKYKNG